MRHSSFNHESNINRYRVRKNLSVKDLALSAKITIASVINLNNGTISPVLQNGQIRPSAQAIADVLQVDLSCLFPAYLCPVKKSKLTGIQARWITAGDQITVDRKSFWKEIYSLFKPRYKRIFLVLRLRSIGWTLEEIGDKLSLTRERVRQIEAKGLRKIRKCPDRLELKSILYVTDKA